MTRFRLSSGISKEHYWSKFKGYSSPTSLEIGLPHSLKNFKTSILRYRTLYRHGGNRWL